MIILLSKETIDSLERELNNAKESLFGYKKRTASIVNELQECLKWEMLIEERVFRLEKDLNIAKGIS